MKNIIAAFDFDGTITKKDTFFDFVFKTGNFMQVFLGLAKSIPVLFLFLIKIIPNNAAKEKIFSCFFQGFEADFFKEKCTRYSLERLPSIIKKEAIGKIRWHLNQGHELVIVSASIENWIKPWAEANGFKKIIATIPEIENNILTGKFKTKNCNGEEKVRRFLAEYPDRQNYYLYVYGDSPEDGHFLDIADKKFYKII